MMTESRELILKAKSLKEAEQLLGDQIPEGFFVKSGDASSYGLLEMKTFFGESEDEAFAEAFTLISPEAEIQDKTLLNKPERRYIILKEYSEQSEPELHKLINPQLSEGEKIESIQLKKTGSKGFLGLGRSPYIYNVAVGKPATVIISFREPVEIKIKIEELPSKSELIYSLDELISKTSKQWLKLDKPVQGQGLALLVMQGAFEFLKKEVSDPFNIILSAARTKFKDNKSIQLFSQLKLGPPEVYDVNDIPLVSQQFKEAINRMMQLREIIF